MKSFFSDALPPLGEHEQNLVYCGLDSCLTQAVREGLESQLDGISRHTYDFEASLLPCVLDMMTRGFKIDIAARDAVVAEKRAQHAQVNAFFRQLVGVTGVETNERYYASNKKLLNLFYNELGLPTQYSSKRGETKAAVDRKALERLAKNYVRATPYANALMTLRELDKSVDALTKNLGPGDRWHASFNIGGTDTGRWSSSKHPMGFGANLQNIDDEDRRCFVADEGYVLLSCDQQGAEARIVAYLSGDEKYIHAVESGDVHTMVASMVWGFEAKRELADQKFYRELSYREVSKKFTHGSSYGGTAPTLAEQARTEIQLALNFQKQFFKTFPGIREWQEWVVAQLGTLGFLISPFGRRRYFWDRLWDEATHRAAIAYVPQSTVGDLTARGLRELHTRVPQVQLLNNVHDAAVVQVPIKVLAETLPCVLDCLEYPLEITDIKGKVRTCRIPWEASIGLNWGKKKKDNPLGLRELKGTAPAVALGELLTAGTSAQ